MRSDLGRRGTPSISLTLMPTRIGGSCARIVHGLRWATRRRSSPLPTRPPPHRPRWPKAARSTTSTSAWSPFDRRPCRPAPRCRPRRRGRREGSVPGCQRAPNHRASVARARSRSADILRGVVSREIVDPEPAHAAVRLRREAVTRDRPTPLRRRQGATTRRPSRSMTTIEPRPVSTNPRRRSCARTRATDSLDPPIELARPPASRVDRSARCRPLPAGTPPARSTSPRATRPEHGRPPTSSRAAGLRHGGDERSGVSPRAGQVASVRRSEGIPRSR